MSGRIPSVVHTILSGEGGLGDDLQVLRFLDCSSDQMQRGFLDGVIDLRAMRFRSLGENKCDLDECEVPRVIGGATKFTFALLGVLGATPRLIDPFGQVINLDSGPAYSATRDWSLFLDAPEHSEPAKAGLRAFSRLLPESAFTLIAGKERDGGICHEIQTALIQNATVAVLTQALTGVLVAVFTIYRGEARMLVDGSDLTELRRLANYAATSGSP